MLFFKKRIKVKEEDLQRYFCVKHKKSGKKIYLNTELIVPNDTLCVFCLRDKPCEVLKTGEYQLNGNSLPTLYKKGKYNKPNKRNYIPNYFFANIWFASQNNLLLDFDIDKIVVKDRTYGRKKIKFSMMINIRINDAEKFFKNLLYRRPHIKTRRVVGAIEGWFTEDVRKYLKRQNAQISDYMCYTRGFNANLQNMLSERFASVGIEVIETIIEDIIMPDDLARELADSESFNREMHEAQGGRLEMTNDGVKVPISYERSSEQLAGSVMEKYKTMKRENEIEVPEQEDMGYKGVNQNSNEFYTEKFNQIKSQIETGKIDNQEKGIDLDLNVDDMYKMADENFTGNQGQYAQSSGSKICAICGREVSLFVERCPYCGSLDFRHKL